jgi:hypothetical protein
MHSTKWLDSSDLSEVIMVFPLLRQDGTFDIRLDFFLEHPVERDAVNQWLASWVQRNDPWEREWRGAGGEVVQIDCLRFFDSFLTVPQCISIYASCVSIRLNGRGSDAFWKDWMVRLIEEIVGDLCIRFDRATDYGISPQNLGQNK